MYSFLHISSRREYSMTKLSDNPRDYPWFRHRMKGFESRYGVSSFLLATSRPFLPRVSAGHFRWTIFPRAQLVGLPCSACCFFFFSFLFFFFCSLCVSRFQVRVCAFLFLRAALRLLYVGFMSVFLVHIAYILS